MPYVIKYAVEKEFCYKTLTYTKIPRRVEYYNRSNVKTLDRTDINQAQVFQSKRAASAAMSWVGDGEIIEVEVSIKETT